ncbi:hypothetical protein SH661x_001310 [Planctomicrobium sp. SH661]|uniref:hypothetical protein n=1 Tax=Planctomicrobium sp. SH661 TaxID=3448124 RepID=UPI003F5AE998
MTFTGIFVATLLTLFLMVMATLSTSMIYAVTQILSRCAEILFDLHLPSRT